MTSYIPWIAGPLLGAAVGYTSRWIYDRYGRKRLRMLEKMNSKLEIEMSERREIERELAHMASFADMAPNSIIETDALGSIGYVNPAAESEFPGIRELGQNHALLEGLPKINELLLREQRNVLTRPIRVGDRVYDQRITLLHGGRSQLRLYMTDITELKRIDQLKTDFVNMVSHELRSPLTTITATIKMVTSGMMGATNDEQSEALALAQTNLDRLARMINDLLDVSKIEAGKLELRRARVDLSALVDEVCRSFEPLARERGLQIRKKPAATPVEAIIDRDKILQVFTNLMNNALKFTSHGHIEVSAEIKDSHVQCRVSDTGPGIAPNDLPKVFSKFAQFATAPTGREKGTGLGLSLCKGFVELHGGKIWVESRVNEGTQFIFMLPCRRGEALFIEHARELITTMVTQGKTLSLLQLSVLDWSQRETTQERDALIRWSAAWTNQIQRLIGVEADEVFQDGGTLFIALPDVTKAMAADIVGRITEHGARLRQNADASWPAALSAHAVTFPDDGHVLEQLCVGLHLKAA